MKDKKKREANEWKDGKKKSKSEEGQVKREEELSKIEVKNVVTQMMISLSSVGYLKLGLPEDTNKDFKDLKQARLAIDSLAALVQVAAPHLSHEEAETFNNTLANLRMSYVAQSKET